MKLKTIVCVFEREHVLTGGSPNIHHRSKRVRNHPMRQEDGYVQTSYNLRQNKHTKNKRRMLKEMEREIGRYS